MAPPLESLLERGRPGFCARRREWPGGIVSGRRPGNGLQQRVAASGPRNTKESICGSKRPRQCFVELTRLLRGIRGERDNIVKHWNILVTGSSGLIGSEAVE